MHRVQIPLSDYHSGSVAARRAFAYLRQCVWVQNLNSWFSLLGFVLIRWSNACLYNVFQRTTGNGLFHYGKIAGIHPTAKMDLMHRCESALVPASADWCVSTEGHCYLHLRMAPFLKDTVLSENHRTHLCLVLQIHSFTFQFLPFS